MSIMTREQLNKYRQRVREASAKPSDKQRYIIVIGDAPTNIKREAFQNKSMRDDLKRKDYHVYMTGHDNTDGFKDKLDGVSMPYGLIGDLSSEQLSDIITNTQRDDWEEPE